MLSFVYDVGAEPGGDPADDVAFRGTGLAAPLFLPVVLIAAAVLARARTWVGGIGATIVGLVGVAFFLGGIFNLPNDLDAARAAGAPTGIPIAFGVVSAILGLALAALAGAELAARFRRRAKRRGNRSRNGREDMEVRDES